MLTAEKYLAALLKYYKKTNSETYILTKLVALEPKMSSEMETLFCKACLHLFVPTVNCKARLFDHYTITCYKCKTETKVNGFLHSVEPENFGFNDFFSL